MPLYLHWAETSVLYTVIFVSFVYRREWLFSQKSQVIVFCLKVTSLCQAAASRAGTECINSCRFELYWCCLTFKGPVYLLLLEWITKHCNRCKKCPVVHLFKCLCSKFNTCCLINWRLNIVHKKKNVNMVLVLFCVLSLFQMYFFSKRSNINLKLRVVNITVHLTPVSSNLEEVVRP